eukprot:12882381-Prorocentrum_lima.AAC.1
MHHHLLTCKNKSDEVLSTPPQGRQRGLQDMMALRAGAIHLWRGFKSLVFVLRQDCLRVQLLA